MEVLLARLTGEPSRQGSHGFEWCKAKGRGRRGRREGREFLEAVSPFCEFIR